MLTDGEIYHIDRLKQYYPYRKIYLVIENGERSILCPKDKRPINKILRAGGQAYEIKEE